MKDFLCWLGIHKYGEWENASYFHDDGWSGSFGWVPLESRECKNCYHLVRREIKNRNKGEALISEANSKRNKRTSTGHLKQR